MNAADRHVLDVVPVGLQVWEAFGDALTLRYANEEAKGQALPDDPGWRQTMLAAIGAQEAATFELEAAGDVWWRAQITPLGAGSILAAYWNITAQKLHERSLKASERLNREILSGLQEGVVVVDTDARVVVANEAAAAIIGVSLDELMDRPLSAVPVDLLDDRGHLLAPEQLPLPRALRVRRSRGTSCASSGATGRCCGSRSTRTRCITTTGSSTGRSRHWTTSRHGSSRTAARATRPTPIR